MLGSKGDFPPRDAADCVMHKNQRRSEVIHEKKFSLYLYDDGKTYPGAGKTVSTGIF